MNNFITFMTRKKSSYLIAFQVCQRVLQFEIWCFLIFFFIYSRCTDLALLVITEQSQEKSFFTIKWNANS